MIRILTTCLHPRAPRICIWPLISNNFNVFNLLWKVHWKSELISNRFIFIQLAKMEVCSSSTCFCASRDLSVIIHLFLLLMRWWSVVGHFCIGNCTNKPIVHLICFFLHNHQGHTQYFHWSLVAMWFFSSGWCVGGEASMSGMWIKAGEFQLGRDSVQLWHTYHPCFPASQMPHRFISHVRSFLLHCSLR